MSAYAGYSEQKKRQRREASRRWIERNHQTQLAMMKANREKRRAWFRTLKATLQCVRCGESHPACLEFHHRHPADKTANVIELAQSTYSEDIILAEIAKCAVLCANCHAKEHWGGGDMNSEELASNTFRAAQTEAKLRREEIAGKANANRTHFEVGRAVRKTIDDLGGTMPEDLPAPAESIKQVAEKERKRLERQAQPLLFPEPDE